MSHEAERQVAGLVDLAGRGPHDAHAVAAADLVGADAALVVLTGSDGQAVIGTAGVDDHPLLLPPLSADVASLLDAGMLVVVPDVAEHDAGNVVRSWDRTARAAVAVPVDLGGRTVGLVVVLSRTPRDWPEDELRPLRTVARMVGSMLPDLLERYRGEDAGLMSMIRHEVGGDLAIVLGGVETAMLDGVDAAARTRVLENARREVLNVMATFDALIRLDDAAPRRTETMSLRDVADRVTERTARRARGRLATEVEQGRLATDGALLVRLLTNVVENALKHTQGDVLLRLSRDGDDVHAEVRDHGGGIDRSTLETLFDPFRRGLEPRASGFGLGLHIVSRIAARLDGVLDVDTSDRGTSITLHLPGVRVHDGPASSGGGAGTPSRGLDEQRHADADAGDVDSGARRGRAEA